MDAEHKAILANELIDRVKADILEAIPQMPEEWDGHEIRQYIAEVFTRNVFPSVMNGKRLKDYRNEVVVRNL